MKIKKICVVGCGSVIRLYFPMLKEMMQKEDLEVVAVCDTNEKQAIKAKEWLEIANHYTDFDMMIAKEDVDIVVNLTPIQAHYEINKKAIIAKKHVYSEKPLAETIDQTNEIIKEAKKNDVIVTCAPPMALHPDHKRIKELIDKGAVGKVCWARTTGSNPGPAWITEFGTDPTWFYMQGGGPLHDTGVYAIQLLTQLLGPAKRVVAFAGTCIPERVVSAGEAKGKKIKVEVPDNIQIMLDFGESIYATADINYCKLSHKDNPRLEVYGDKGIIYHYQRQENPIEIYRRDDDLDLRGWMTVDTSSFWGACIPYMDMSAPARAFSWAEGVKHLIDCIDNEETPVIGAEFARHVIEISNKVIESAELGQVMELETTF